MIGTSVTLSQGEQNEGTARRFRYSLTSLVVFGVILAAGYALGVTTTMPLMRGIATPLLDFGHLGVVGDSGMAVQGTVIAAMFLPYYLAWRLVARLGNDRTVILTVFGFAVLFSIILVPAHPTGSSDVFMYLFQGRIFSEYHANPFLAKPEDFPMDQLLPFVPWRGLSSTYGPLAAVVSSTLSILSGPNSMLGIILFKILASGLSVVTSFGVYRILERTASGFAAAGTLLISWNPLMIFETAGNAHYDIWMAAFAVLSLYAFVSGRFRLSSVLMALSALLKFVSGIFIPLLFISKFKSDRKSRSTFCDIGIGGAMIIALAAVSYAPFWVGAETLGFTKMRYNVGFSLQSFVMLALKQQGLEEQSLIWVINLTYLLAMTAYMVIAVQLVRRCEDPREACFDAFLVFVSIGTAWFQPWYLITLIALGAVCASEWRKHFAIVFSFGAALNYAVCSILNYIKWENGVSIQIVGVLMTFLPPMIYGVFTRYRRSIDMPPSRTLTG